MQSKMQQELNTTQEVAMRLTKHNKQLQEEAATLRAQFKCQEDDRGYLIKQNVLAKKENDARANVLDKVTFWDFLLNQKSATVPIYSAELR